MATLEMIKAARDDLDLRDRFAVAAQTAGLPWVDESAVMGRLVSTPVGDGTQTIADVYGFSVSKHQPYTDKDGRAVCYELTAGADPAYVTDALILEAVDKVRRGVV